MGNVRTQRNESIQILRGVCAMMVFLSHTLMMYRNEMIDRIYHSPFHLFFDGSVAVYVFFAISGFFYYKDINFSTTGYIAGVRKKIIKIYPPHFVVLVIGMALCNSHLDYAADMVTDWGNGFWHQDISVKEVLRQSLILFPRDTKLINPPSWYLNIEVLMFLAMPIVVALFNRVGWKWSNLLFVVALLTGVMEGVAFFTLAAYAHYLIDNKGLYVRFFANKYQKLVLLVISVGLINNCNEFNGPENISEMLKALGGAILVSLAYTTSMSVKLLKYFGDVSYEFYLIHFPILLALRYFNFSIPIYVGVAFVASLLSAWLLNNIDNYIVSKSSLIKIKNG